MDRIELQEHALLLMYKYGEVEVKQQKVKMFDYKGALVGEKIKIVLHSKPDVKPKGKRKMIPQQEIEHGFD